MKTTIPYAVKVEELDGAYNASVPTLGASLFHAYGETEGEAIESLESIFDALVEWHKENIGPLPPPTFCDLDEKAKVEARNTSFGLQCIIGKDLDGRGSLQPNTCSHQTVRRSA